MSMVDMPHVVVCRDCTFGRVYERFNGASPRRQAERAMAGHRSTGHDVDILPAAKVEDEVLERIRGQNR